MFVICVCNRKVATKKNENTNLIEGHTKKNLEK